MAAFCLETRVSRKSSFFKKRNVNKEEKKRMIQSIHLEQKKNVQSIFISDMSEKKMEQESVKLTFLIIFSLFFWSTNQSTNAKCMIFLIIFFSFLI